MTNLVSLENGRVTTSSLIVAQHFNKRHDVVLRSIQNLECSEDFTHHNFAVSEYKDNSGKSNKCYIITKDGFTFLVMGFTGKEAAIWKERFINAFNEMEAKLRNMKQPELDLTNAGAMSAACDVAFKYFDDFRAAVKAGKDFAPMNDIPSDVLAGMLCSALRFERFILSFDHNGKMNIRPMPDPYEGLARAIADPSNIGLQDSLIEEIGQACVTALAHRAKCRKEAINKIRSLNQ
jgi:Rha family phage regulatory protein